VLIAPRVPRPPFVPDPLRRSRIPRDLDAVTTVGSEIDPADVGLERDDVERVWRSVRGLYRSGVHPAIALCLRREGQVVLDRAIGHARGNGPQDDRDVPKVLATPETPFVIMSASKALTATVAHLLDERGVIHIADRVCEYIPEYAAHGKDAITIAHVLSHRAGVPNLPREALDVTRIDDREFIVKILCDAKPASRPGRALAYHAISGGFIIGEIVERVCGRTIREVLADEILEPLGFERCNYGVAPGDVDNVAVSYATGPPALPPVSTLVRRAIGAAPDEAVAIANDPRFLTGIVPAGNVVATANELSRFFELLRAGGELDGVRVLEPRTIRRAITEQSYREIDLTLGFPIRYSLGFMLGAQLLSLFGPDTELAFGHLGYTNVIGWADPERELSGALLTSGKPVLYPELPQLLEVMRRIGQAVPKVPTSALAFEATLGPFA
jgi:CubicO group peptidase (beta-lactamase class C family)